MSPPPGTETRRAERATAERDVGNAAPVTDGAPLGAVVALTVVLGVAAFVLVLAAVILLVPSKPITGYPSATQRQSAESALYLVAFVVVLPLAVAFVPRAADRLAARPSGPGLSLLAATLAVSAELALVIARLLPGSSAAEALGVIAAWWIVAVAALARASRPQPWGALLRHAHRAPLAWAVAGALLFAVLLLLATLTSISVLPMAIGAVLVVLVVVLYARTRAAPGLPRPSRGWGAAIDAGVVALLVLTIPNLVIFSGGFEASVIQFHQDFLLGPTNQLLAGDGVLVHTASQYGVAPLYLLGAWFQVAPIGYGTLGFLDGLLYVLLFATGYAVLRLAGTKRTLAAAALALAVVTLTYNLIYPVGGLLQHGPLRFGLPMLVVLFAVMGARWPRHARAASTAGLVVVGLSAIWALEAFAYTAVTFGALICLEARSRPGTGRLRWLARRAALGVAACVIAHVGLALATLAFTGSLPNWDLYLGYLHALLYGGFADYTYDFTNWSPGLAVGVGYAASAAGLVLLTLRRPAVIARERTTFTALAGITAYGIALYTYFVNRSTDDILPYVSFPAILAGTLWLSLLLRAAPATPRRLRAGGLAFALSLAVLLLATAWSSIGGRFDQTPLAYAIPGGKSLSAAMTRLWHPPPIDRRAPAAQRLLDRYFPGRRRVPVLVRSDLGTEILLRSGRAQALPFDDPFQDFFAESPTTAAMRRAVSRLKAGDRLLTDDASLKILAALQRTHRDGLHHPIGFPLLTPEQEWILQRIAERFGLHVLARDPQGFVVVRLEGR